MKVTSDINKFKRELICVYKDESYSVRDNGAVYRHSKEGKKNRVIDNTWIFGKLNKKTGYFEIASIRVHRIIATAFHNEPISKDYVVDHIDTNKQNNRPENLRWVTRLENILLNPITSKRIVLVCGSVEAFLENPSKFRDKFQDPNYNWMSNVSADEAQISLQRLLSWASNDNVPIGGSLGDWIYSRTYLQNLNEEDIEEDYNVGLKSLTENATQRNWQIPSGFPCCPKEYDENPIIAYRQNLKTGSVFCTNDIYTSHVLKTALSDNFKEIYVLSESEKKERAIKPWSLAKITFKNDIFVHTSLGSYFKKDGAEKYFCLAQGLEWHGGDTFDDFC
jgi:hypothetical protein